jgi:hypothetical protein
MGLMDKFASSKAAPKFEDDGPPVAGADEVRGGGGSGDDEADMKYPDEMGDEGGGGAGAPSAHDDVSDAAADDLGDLAGVAPEDRQDFKAALKTYVTACISQAMSDQDSGGPPSDGGDISEEG